MSEPLATTAEVADWLSCDQNRVRFYIHEWGMPAIRVPRGKNHRWLIVTEDLWGWMNRMMDKQEDLIDQLSKIPPPISVLPKYRRPFGPQPPSMEEQAQLLCSPTNA